MYWAAPYRFDDSLKHFPRVDCPCPANLVPTPSFFLVADLIGAQNTCHIGLCVHHYVGCTLPLFGSLP